MNRIVLFVVSLLAAVAMTGNAAAQSSSAPVGVQYQSGNGSGALCMNMFVPIDLADVPDAVIYGELCAPPNASPNTVELLVHGTNYDHFYWDWPANPHQYSHVGNAIDHGYATFNIDRIGTGWSTKPLSFTFPSSDWIQSLHQLVVGLRDGSIGGSPFANVVYFGSSLTVVQGWLLAEAYPGDIDAFIMTGLSHLTTPTFFGLVQTYIIPACMDPKFSDLDCGYLATVNGSRPLFFYHEGNISQANVTIDQLLHDVAPGPATFETAAYVLGNPDVATSPSQAIDVPVLLAMGEFDATTCGPDGITCTVENLLALEAPFYQSAPVLDAYIAPNTGHALTLHYTALDTANFIHSWIDSYVGN
jgi:pimeloyl-ACP methyl ester carboxylesterase